MVSPEYLDQWFPFEQQHSYVSMLIAQMGRRVGLTRRRAEYFVRLWAYLLIKQQLALGKKIKPPIKKLSLPKGFIPCTHREAAEVFYASRERGGERSAGMMLDRLVDLGLIEKHFDGNTICLQVNQFLNLMQLSLAEETIEFEMDNFNPITDAIPVASLLVRNYPWINGVNAAMTHRILRFLRHWGQQYPTGMRVLRRHDNSNPVGFSFFYPIARESESIFFQTPAESLHLSTVTEDLIQMAVPGSKSDCTAIFVRSWIIDQPYMQKPQMCQLFEDGKRTLVRMREDFPQLSDVYNLIIHPSFKALAEAVGFQTIFEDANLDAHLMYLPIDRFLALDVQQVIERLSNE